MLGRLLGPKDPEGPTTRGTGRRLLRGQDGCAAVTTMKMIFDGDCGRAALANAANLVDFATAGAGYGFVAGDEAGAAGTAKMEDSLNVAFDNEFKGHVRPPGWVTYYH